MLVVALQVDAQSDSGTPLTWAAGAGHVAAAAALLAAGAQVDLADERGITALGMATAAGHDGMVRGRGGAIVPSHIQ